METVSLVLSILTLVASVPGMLLAVSELRDRRACRKRSRDSGAGRPATPALGERRAARERDRPADPAPVEHPCDQVADDAGDRHLEDAE